MPQNEVFLLQARIDALPAHVAILDEHGTILACNTAWRGFAETQGEDQPGFEVGADYLATCDAAARQGRRVPETIAAGLRAVIAGEQDIFRQVYGSPLADPEV